MAWDNLNSHVSRAMAELAAARSWLTAYRLPPYASELNPVETVWSNLKISVANLTKQEHRPAGCAGQSPAEKDAVRLRLEVDDFPRTEFYEVGVRCVGGTRILTWARQPNFDHLPLDPGYRPPAHRRTECC
ncbi:MAG: transposase, partial [Trebonia sp.]